MRGQLGVGLGEVEVVGELGAVLLLAVADLGDQPAAGPHPFAQRADQVGVLAEALDQDGAGAVQCGGRVGDLLVQEGRGERGRVLGRVGEQRVGQRFEAGLAGDLRLGAPLGLVREVDVLQPGLGVGGEDLRAQRVVQLALGVDGLQHGGAALLQLAQVAQPLLQGAQLGVVEGAGGFLAVARDEGDGRSSVEQADGGLHLVLADAQFLGDLAFDGHGHDAGHPF